jgi:outer membrane receptor for monomeric catechols
VPRCPSIRRKTPTITSAGAIPSAPPPTSTSSRCARSRRNAAKSFELGAKWLLFDGDLALRAALYQATKDWERNGDLESTAAILTKKRRTNGIELEVAGASMSVGKSSPAWP